MSVDDEVMEAQLVAVFDHYDIPEPRSGERPFKCPVHDDAHASASVNRERGLWKCHGCGEGGSAVTMVQLKENLDFFNALKFIRSLTGGVVVPVKKVRKARANRSGRWIPPSLRGTA